MAYVIERFGVSWATAAVLPLLEGSQPQGVGPVGSSLVALPGGGAYDWRGADQAPMAPEVLRARGVWVANSVTDMETKLAALKALCGRRDRLWRSNGTTQHWRMARLLEVKSDLEAGLAADALMELLFEAMPGPWSGVARTVNTSLDSSPKTVPCTNGGNRRITNAVVTITAAGTAITTARVRVSGVSDFQWQGSLAVGQSLVIDCGARTIRNNGVNAYSGLSYLSGHVVSDWLRLEPGANSVEVYRTGGSVASTVQITFSDGWA